MLGGGPHHRVVAQAVHDEGCHLLWRLLWHPAHQRCFSCQYLPNDKDWQFRTLSLALVFELSCLCEHLAQVLAFNHSGGDECDEERCFHGPACQGSL